MTPKIKALFLRVMAGVGGTQHAITLSLAKGCPIRGGSDGSLLHPDFCLHVSSFYLSVVQFHPSPSTPFFVQLQALRFKWNRPANDKYLPAPTNICLEIWSFIGEKVTNTSRWKSPSTAEASRSMSRHDVGSWIRSFSIFRPTYSRLPEGDENGATTEKAHASRSATRSHWKSTLLRYSPAVIIPLLILLALLFARRPILDTLHPTKFSDDPGADVYVNPDKTHYVPLKPGTFDSDQPYRKALVLASFSKQHVEWLSELNDEYVSKIAISYIS